jgi:t-SNARE complex subunit (syntaxin)
MNLQMSALVLGWIGMVCWLVCFWWMHRISSRQDTMLKELHEMTTRIEDLSRAEHDLIRDVHPQVGEIKEKVEDVADAVSAGTTNTERSAS